MTEEPGPSAGRATWLRYADGRWDGPHPATVGVLPTPPEPDGAFLWVALDQPDPAGWAAAAERLRLHPGEDAVAFHVGTVAAEAGGAAAARPGSAAGPAPAAGAAPWSAVVGAAPGPRRTGTGTLSLTVGRHAVLTVSSGAGGDVAPAIRVLRARQARGADPWTVVHAVLQQVFAAYPAVVDDVADAVNRLEERVFSPVPDGATITHTYRVARELVDLRRVVVHAQRPLNTLLDDDAAPLPHHARRGLRHLRDHVAHLVDQLNAYDDMVNSLLQARLAQVSVAQNDDMRKIAAWAAIGGVQTVIAGVYGMNFRHMPELDWRYGYPAVLAAMLATALLLYRVFRRAGWL
ncbi:MAG TPA: CorA family divalent cation transporter [Pilimelia sp.]|nr:CorA family divalent cation transporter [Pilimelia sp.]